MVNNIILCNKTEFLKKIENRIESGKKIDRRLNSIGTMSEAMEEYDIWDNYNQSLLSNSFESKDNVYIKGYYREPVIEWRDIDFMIVSKYAKVKVSALERIIYESEFINEKKEPSSLGSYAAVGGLGVIAGLLLNSDTKKAEILKIIQELPRKHQIFISSTYEDLKTERAEISKVILESNNIPRSMEQFPASSMKQIDFIKKVIDECDYLILIIGHRYGQTFEISEGRSISYTEWEYDYAKSRDTPILTFIKDGIQEIDDMNSAEKRMVDNLINKVSSSVRKKWIDCNELKYEVSVALNHEIKNNPRPGWISATSFDIVKK